MSVTAVSEPPRQDWVACGKPRVTSSLALSAAAAQGTAAGEVLLRLCGSGFSSQRDRMRVSIVDASASDVAPCQVFSSSAQLGELECRTHAADKPLEAAGAVYGAIRYIRYTRPHLSHHLRPLKASTAPLCNRCSHPLAPGIVRQASTSQSSTLLATWLRRAT